MEIARVPTIYNLVLTTAGTEYPQVLNTTDQPTIKKVQIKSRTKSDDLSYSWVTAGNFVTIFGGQTYWEDNLEAWQLTLFIKGTVNGQVAEIEVWV
jgi:hypothetical protein